MRSFELHAEAGQAAATGAPRDGYNLQGSAATRQIEQIRTQSVTIA